MISGIVKRKGELALRWATPLFSGKNKYLEIVKVYKNTYYGQRDNMISSGKWKDNGEEGLTNVEHPNMHIHKSCFENKHSCYSICTFLIKGYDIDMKLVGTRLLELKKKKHFFKLSKKAVRILKKKIEED